ncbi:hypothetical protein ACFZCG_18745 [Streptomyces tanashiensis]|uniref:hypothetical protein n=1 Tax=Streptomyces tanashiensis TaxID=67367 RepID=UPI0036E26C09
MDARHSPTTRMLALGNRAALLKELGRHAEARAALREAPALRPDDLDDFHQALLLGQQGYVSEPTDLRLAISYHLQSLELATRIGAEGICLVALAHTGHCHLALQEPEAALSRFGAALAIRATGVMHGNAEREIRVGTARALRLLGRPDEARRACETLLGLASKRGDTSTRGLAEHEYGHALRACGDARAAREHWWRALRALDGTDALVLPELQRLVGLRPTPGGSHHSAPEHCGPYEAPGARDHRDFEAVQQPRRAVAGQAVAPVALAPSPSRPGLSLPGSPARPPPRPGSSARPRPPATGACDPLGGWVVPEVGR